MSVYSNPPKAHLRDPRYRSAWTACGLMYHTWIKLTKDYKEVTCKNCKRTNVYRMKRLGVQRDDWHE